MFLRLSLRLFLRLAPSPATPQLSLLLLLCAGSGAIAQSGRDGRAANANPGATSPALEAMREATDVVFRQYDRPDSPGCALGVIQDGQHVYNRGYGMANLEHEIPIGANSIFRIGSTSKQFAAAAVLLLEHDGLLSTSDPIRKYIPELQKFDPPVTVEHLVHHTSGFRDYLALMSLRGEREDDWYTNEEVLDLLSRQRSLNFEPGSQWTYSNSGYFLLSVLVERVSGKSLSEFAEERMFAPLEMEHSHFHDDAKRIVPQRAAGYGPRKGGGWEIQQTTLEMVGDGGVFTSSNDLLLWDRAFSTEELFDTATREKQVTPAVLSGGESTTYGYGLFVEDYRGQKTVSHGGAFVGYRAEMLRFPQLQFTVSVLCNVSTANPSQLAHEVADIFLAEQLDPMPEPTADGPTTSRTLEWGETQDKLLEAPGRELSRQQLERWTGVYQLGRNLWTVSTTPTDPTRLVLDNGRLGALELQALTPDFFRVVDEVDMLVDFGDAQGSADSAQAADQPAATRLRARSRRYDFDLTLQRVVEREVTADEARRLEGRYFSEELGVHYVIRPTGGDDSRLEIHLADAHRDFFDTPLLPLPEAHHFVVSGMTLRFEGLEGSEGSESSGGARDSGAAATGFRLDAGRVRNLIFERVGDGE